MIINGDCLEELKKMPEDSIDAVISDPPYGIKFMSKRWDVDVPSLEIMQECLRVLKPGGWCMVMSAPRSDVQNAMISRLMEAGFRLDFTPIYWTYASGFPKAGNIGKLVDKRLGVEREVIGENPYNKLRGVTTNGTWKKGEATGFGGSSDLTAPATDQAKALDGSYTGFQPKPAVEVCIAAQKPLCIQQILTITTSQLIIDVECLNVSIAAKSSSLYPTLKDSIVHELAQGNTSEEVITQVGEVAELSDQMDMLKSTLDTVTDGQYTNWNIVTLWQSILVVLLKRMNTYTTETMNALTTDLKTLSYLLSTNTPVSTTQDNTTTPNGFMLNVDTVESVLKSVLTKSLSQVQTTALQSAGKPTEPNAADTPASVAVTSSRPTTLNESTVAKPATTKPEVSVVIVAMKPLSEKTYVDQALKNRKGITWLDDCRVPTENGQPITVNRHEGYDSNSLNGSTAGKWQGKQEFVTAGRFPANLLVSDDVLNDGVRRHKGGNKVPTVHSNGVTGFSDKTANRSTYSDEGSYSRYFDLDKWAAAHLTEQQMKTFPFAIFPKASKSEKNKGLVDITCSHPTVKPLKLMSYLITLTTREGDTVLDPFVGSGTTVVAANSLNRKGIGIEREEEYAEIARARVEANRPEPQLPLGGVR